MKQHYLSFILLVLLALNLNSQNYRGKWDVVSIVSNGNTINLPSSATIAPNIQFRGIFSTPPIDGDYWGADIIGNGICNTFTSYFDTEPNNEMRIIPYFETSNNTCNTTEETNFENLLFGILQQPGNIAVSFSNNLHNMSMTNALGEVINFSREEASPNPISGQWFLHRYWDFDVLYENQFDSGAVLSDITILFNDDNTNGHGTFTGSSICDSFSGTYHNPVQKSSFIIRTNNWTQNTCSFDSSDEQAFHWAFISFFIEQGEENIFTYEINGSGDDAILYVENGYEDFAEFRRQPLSVNEVSQHKTKLINKQAEQRLQLISDIDLTNMPYTIYDISGRTIVSSQIENSKNININTLANGIYILNLQTSEQNVTSFKFIKN